MIISCFAVLLSVLLVIFAKIGIYESKKNEGKMAMYCFALLFLMLGLFAKPLAVFFKMPVGKLLLLIQIPVICFFALMLYVIVSGFVFKATGKSKYMLLLGTLLDGKNPGPLLKGRLGSALNYLNCNKDMQCVVTGGQVGDEIISEGECMFDFLSQNGIDESRLNKEQKSETTYYNFLNSKPVLQSIGYEPDAELDVVTDLFHFARSRKLALKCGYKNVRFICARTDYIHSVNWFFREMLVILKIWIEGPETK